MNAKEAKRVEQAPRRGFVARSLAIAGGLILGATDAHSFRTASAHAEDLRTPDNPFLGHYPTEGYIPAGYRLRETRRNPVDGFRGGDHEIVRTYSNPDLAIPDWSPLTIYLSPQPTRGLGMFDGGATESVNVRIADTTEDIEGRYYDGFWQSSYKKGQDRGISVHHPYWDTTRFHAVVFHWHSMSVGIQGDRRGHLDRDELLRIASALSWQSRA